MNTYKEFLNTKQDTDINHGIDIMPEAIHPKMFDWQKQLIIWATRKGRCAIFADCGLGKTPMQLIWAQNIVSNTNKPVLILAPLAVSSQTVREGEKFNI